MRRLILFLLIFSTAMLAAPASTYVGTWRGVSSEGDMKIALTPAAEQGRWNADVSFTYTGADVKCKTVSVKVADGKVELVYDFEIGDFQGRSTLTGNISATEISATYHTKGADGSDVDQGTVKATVAK